MAAPAAAQPDPASPTTIPAPATPPPDAAPAAVPEDAGPSVDAAAPEPGPAQAPAVAAAPAPRPAAAQEEARLQFGLTLGFTWESEDHSSVGVAAPVLQGRVVLAPSWLVDVDWGFAFLADSEGTSSRAGNPWLKGWYRSQVGNHRWRVGAGITAPLAAVTLGADGRLQRQLYNEALAMWGAWDMWRWTPGRMAAPVQAELFSSIHRNAGLQAEAAVAPLFGVRDGETGTDIIGQAALGVCLMAAEVSFCPRVQAVLLPEASVDRLQTALGARVTWTSGWGRFFVGALLNLDEPLGVSGRGTRNWSIQIGKAFDQ